MPDSITVSPPTAGAPHTALFAMCGLFITGSLTAYSQSIPLIPASLVTRKLHRYYGAQHLHFITCSCFQRQPILGTAERRFYDFNVWSAQKQTEKVKYMHWNPVKRGSVERPDQWRWCSIRPYLYSETVPVRVRFQEWALEIKPRPLQSFGNPHSIRAERERVGEHPAKSYTARRVLTCRTGSGRRRSACSPDRSRCRLVHCRSACSEPQGCLSIHRMTRPGLVTYW
jgi:hypothetical protein